MIFGSARIDERGKISGGKAGSQTAKEISTQEAYVYKGGWDVCIRIKDKKKREKFINFMKWACSTSLVGYDQSERWTLNYELKRLDYNYTKLDKKCECDCSSLVSCGLIVAGFKKINPLNTTSTLEDDIRSKYPKDFTFFTKHYKNGDHTKIIKWQRNGDILNKVAHHVGAILSGGRVNTVKKAPKKYDGVFPKLPKRGYFKKGDKGLEVKRLQNLLIWAGYPLKQYGADGDYEDETVEAVNEFMRHCGFKKINGMFGKKSLAYAKKLKR